MDDYKVNERVRQALQSVMPIMTAIVTSDEFSQDILTEDLEDYETMVQWVIGLSNFCYLLILSSAWQNDITPLEVIQNWSTWTHIVDGENDV